MHCYRVTNQWHLLPAVLDRLEPNIQDPRWQHKIIFHRALHAVGLEWNNREGAKQELKRLPPIVEVNDVDILTFYLDIIGDELTLKERLDLADRIVDLTDDPGIVFNYGALKGIYSMLLGELDDAERQISSCIEKLRTARPTRLSPFVENKLAKALATKVAIRLHSMDADIQTARDLGEARYFYNKLLKERKFTAKGEADVYVEMADTYCFEADWKLARYYYDLARQSDPEEELYKILSAKCDIQLGELQSVRCKLREVDATKLDLAGYADYAFQYAALALRSEDAEDVEYAKSYLAKTKSRWPYFREERDKYKISLLSQKRSKERVKAGRQLGMLSTILRYVNIGPGLFGVSVDLNKVIEDWAAKKEGDTKRVSGVYEVGCSWMLSRLLGSVPQMPGIPA